MKLYEYGNLNQTKLMSYCGLNNVKHKEILDDMAKKELINKMEEAWGSKTIINYKISEKGMEILKEVLERCFQEMSLKDKVPMISIMYFWELHFFKKYSLCLNCIGTINLLNFGLPVLGSLDTSFVQRNFCDL